MYFRVLYVAFMHSNHKKGKTHNKHTCEETELPCLQHGAMVTEGDWIQPINFWPCYSD